VLKDCIEACYELPHGGVHLQVIKDAKVLLARIQEEKRITALLENAIAGRDIQGLKSALATHAAVSPPFNTPLAAEATAVLARLEEELKLKTELVKAIAARDKAGMTQLVARAEEMGFDFHEKDEAKSLIERIEQEEVLLVKLKAVMAKEVLDQLNEVLMECSQLGMDANYEKDMNAAKELKAKLYAIEMAKEEERKRIAAEEERQRLALEAIEAARNLKINEARDKLKAALASRTIANLNVALQEAVKLGANIPEVAEARAMMEGLKKLEEAKSQLTAAMRVLTTKAESGISEMDMQPLVLAMEAGEKVATGAGDFPEIVEAREKRVMFEKYVAAKTGLDRAYESKDRQKLRSALDTAEDLELTLDIMLKARDMLKELDLAAAALQARTGIPADGPPVGGATREPEEAQPYDAAEEARKMRQEIAKQPRFDVKNFPNLRTADDFARGAILNKSKIKEQFLTFQPNGIPKSVTDLNKENNKLALQIHKDLLGYMGDKQLPFPAMLAQDILRKGYEYKPIRDEIYLLIIKQLSNNPRPESVAKGWQVMCMCVGTFPPSPEFENFLLHYIIEKRDRGRGAIIDYAKYCLRTLEAILNSGDGTGFVPSVEEILAYKERPPILATIYLVDGNVITENLPLTPDLNVGKVLEMCSGWLDLKDPRVNTLGMFVYDLGELDAVRMGEDPYAKAAYADLKRTPRPLRNEDYMGDTIVQKARQRRKFKFVLKRKIFLPRYNYRGDDPFFERMTYLQAEDETIIQGNIEITDEQEAVHVAAISLAVAFGEETPETVEDLVAVNVVDFVPPLLRDTRAPEEWAEEILTYRDQLVFTEPDDLQEQFLQIVQSNASYGCHWFYAHKLEPQSYAGIPSAVQELPYDLMVAFNSEGMHIYNFSRQALVSFPYSDICRWGGSSSQFSLIMADDQTNESYEFVLITSQAADMAAIILDHIRAIMAEQEEEA
jgi:myosin-7